MAFGEIVGGLSANWLLYASMPLVAALIGYLTKRAAIWMMFRPLEFRGVPPLLGWQGVTRATPSASPRPRWTPC